MYGEAQTSSQSVEGLAPYILIVEDSEVDFEIISRAFKKINFTPNLKRCCDGDRALEVLYDSAESREGEKIPRLVLLDLNMPGTGGCEVLAEMKNHPVLSKIPVIVLSSSSNEYDLHYCLSIGANKYLKKPISFEEFAETASAIRGFWGQLFASQ